MSITALSSANLPYAANGSALSPAAAATGSLGGSATTGVGSESATFSPESIAALEAEAASEMLTIINSGPSSSGQDLASLLTGSSSSGSSQDLMSLLAGSSSSGSSQDLASLLAGGTTASSASLSALLAGSGTGSQDLASLLGPDAGSSAGSSPDLASLLASLTSASTTGGDASGASIAATLSALGITSTAQPGTRTA
jgi:hypothetical protein